MRLPIFMVGAIITILVSPSASAKFELFPYQTQEDGERIYKTYYDYETVRLERPRTFSFFNNRYSTIHVSENGAVSFKQGLDDYEPMCTEGGTWPAISPFWADVDMSKRGDPALVGKIIYRESNNSIDLGQAEDFIGKAFPSKTQLSLEWTFIVTWINVTHSKPRTCPNTGDVIPRNTFQLVLTTDANGKSWVILLYEKLEWSSAISGRKCETGVPARAGFDSDDAYETFYPLQGSCSPNILKLANDSNIGVPGRWVFRVDHNFSDTRCKNLVEMDNKLELRPRFAAPGDILIVETSCLDNSSTVGPLELGSSGINLPPLAIDYRTNKILYQMPWEEQLFITQGRFNLRVNISRGSSFHPVNYHSGVLYSTYNSAPLASVSFANAEANSNRLNLIWDRSEKSFLRKNFVFVTCCMISNKTSLEWKEMLSPMIVTYNNGSINLTLDNSGLEEGRNLEAFNMDFYLFPTTQDSNSIHSHLQTYAQNRSRLSPTLDTLLPDTLHYFLINREIRPIIATFPFPQKYLDNIQPGVSRIKAQERCDAWYRNEPGIPLTTPGIVRCPPTVALVTLDKRFILHTSGGVRPSEVNIFRQRTPSRLRAVNQCSFDQTGKIVSSTRKTHHDAPGLFVIHPGNRDLVAFGDCCKFSDNCDKYFEKRPLDPGDAYDPPALAKCVGDPHLTTLDGKSYMFNGKGEYWMVWRSNNSDGLVMQVRFEQLGKGSVSTAYVTSYLGDLLQVEMDSGSGLNLYMNGKRVDLLLEHSVAHFVSGGFSVTRLDGWYGKVLVTASSGFTLTFTRSGRALNVLAVVTTTPESIGSLGLWGQFDTVYGNDFMPRNNETRPSLSTSNSEALHSEFGLTWMVKEEESLFLYQEYKNYSRYYDPNFRPDSFKLPAIGGESWGWRNRLCGHCRECHYDYEATGLNEELAVGTKNFIEKFQTMEAAFSQFRQSRPKTTTTTPSTTTATTTTTASTTPKPIPTKVCSTPSKLKLDPAFVAPGEIMIVTIPCPATNSTQKVGNLQIGDTGLKLSPLGFNYRTNQIVYQVPGEDQLLSMAGRVEMRMNLSYGNSPTETLSTHFYTTSNPLQALAWPSPQDRTKLHMQWNQSAVGFAGKESVMLACCIVQNQTNPNPSTWVEMLSPMLADNNGSILISLNNSVLPKTSFDLLNPDDVDFYLIPINHNETLPGTSPSNDKLWEWQTDNFAPGHLPSLPETLLNLIREHVARPILARIPLLRLYLYYITEPVRPGFVKKMAEERCNKWYGEDRGISLTTPGLVRCPPNDSLAAMDDRFREDTSSRWVELEYYHPGMKTSYRQKTPAKSGAANQCVYNSSGHIMSTGVGRSTVDAATGKASHIFQDVIPFGDCCKFSDNCEKYFERRPADPGDAYEPPVVAKSVGDPHLTTLDGMSYMFNGKGEYWMIFRNSVSGFEMQVRFEQHGKGSVATAFVLAQSGELLQIESGLYGAIKVTLDRKVVEFDGQEGSFVSKGFEVEHTAGPRRTVTVSSSAGFTLQFTRSGRSLNVVASASPNNFTTESFGLWGRFDGVRKNDFVPRNNLSLHLPSNSSSETLHYDFGLTWMITAEESLFTYERHQNYSTYYDPDFRPNFEYPELSNISVELITRCGNSRECLFDLAATGGDSDVAVGTKEIAERLINLESTYSQLRQMRRAVEQSMTRKLPITATTSGAIATTASDQPPLPTTQTTVSPDTPTTTVRSLPRMILLRFQISIKNLPDHDGGFWPRADPYLKVYIRNFYQITRVDKMLISDRLVTGQWLVERTATYQDRTDAEWTLNTIIPFFPEIKEMTIITEIWDEDFKYDDKMYVLDNLFVDKMVLPEMLHRNLTRENPAVFEYTIPECCSGTRITWKAYEVEVGDDFRFPIVPTYVTVV